VILTFNIKFYNSGSRIIIILHRFNIIRNDDRRYW